MGELLETYGTYESNGVIISDVDEIWYVETIGGHHWIARRVPDDCYATIPNQLGIDDFDLATQPGEQREYMCSADLREFMAVHHLDRTMGATMNRFNPRSLRRRHCQRRIFTTRLALVHAASSQPERGLIRRPPAIRLNPMTFRGVAYWKTR